MKIAAKIAAQTAGAVGPALERAIRLVRGLRFRLTLSYVLFFSVLLIAIGLLFRQALRSEMNGDVQALLEEEWGAAKGYLRIENQRPIWVEDSTDPEEAYIVDRLRHIYLLTDANGYLLERSDTYHAIGDDTPDEIARVLRLPKPEVHIRRDPNGVPYLIKAGAVPDERGQPYFFALGRSLEDNERTVNGFTRTYFLLLPAMIALTSVAGWVLAGRAIRPLNSVAHAAQEITGVNLSTQIPNRGAGDELDNLIDSFNRMTRRLSQSFDQMRQFSTDVSHELRTPLTAIRGQLEVALFTADNTEQYRDAMVNALEDVEKLSSIVRALLLLSQAESGQLVLQKSLLNLGEVAADVVDQFQIPAEEKGLALTALLEESTFASADRTQMERMLSNLLSNAIKYTPKGGSIHVRAGADPERPGWTRIVVEDSGVGIAPENLPHIFDRFYRVRSAQTNKIEGLGLGLSFVSWIVSAHGGDVHVESTPGKGSRFEIRLPATAPLAQQVSLEPSPESVPS
jgi:heavy metal sensor kinase